MLFFPIGERSTALSGMFYLGALLFVLMSVSCSTSPFASPRDSVFGNYLIGRHAENQGDMVTAISSLNDVLQKNKDDPELLYRLFLLNLSSGNFEEVRRLAESLSEREQGNDLVGIFFGLSKFIAGDNDLALKAFASLHNSPAKDWIAPIVSAWILWDDGQHDEAMARLEKLGKDVSRTGIGHFHGAIMADLLGDTERAEEHYRLAIETVDVVLLRFVEGYGNFLERQKRKEDARRLYQEYAQMEGFGQDLSERRRLAMQKSEKPSPLIRNGLEGSAELFHGVYSFLAQGRNDGTAIVWLRFALFLRPDFFGARLLLAEQYRQLGFQRTALENYRTIPIDSPHYVNSGIQISRVLERMEETNEAQKLLIRLREEVPDSKNIALRVAEYYRIHEHYEEAIKAYSSLIDALEMPLREDWSLFFGRAVAYERSGKWPQAEADLQVAIELSDEHPLVLNYLGYSWVEQGERLNLALGMLKKATRARPRNGYIVDSLGWAYYKLGAFDKANLYLERAVQLEPDDPVINNHLGDSLWRVGRKLEARFQWRRALLLEPEEKEIAVIEEKLLRGLPLDDSY